MQYSLAACLVLCTVAACKENPAGKAGRPAQEEPVCVPGEDTAGFVTTFAEGNSGAPTDRFYALVDFINGKSHFKPGRGKTGKLEIKKESSKVYTIAYDSCNASRLVVRNFVMRNILVSTLNFAGTRKEEFTRLTPGIHVEEWKFANNADRDSALKIVQTVYRHPKNVIMYTKRHSQFILDDKRIFLLETGAAFAEPYVLQCRKRVEEFIQANNTGL